MERRAYLAGVAGAASLLAGCSSLDGGGDGDDGASTPTVTPAPVPDTTGDSGPIVADGAVRPASVGAAHVGALVGGNARVAVEYTARTEAGAPVEIIRVVATLDDGAMTYRRYVRRPLDLGGKYQLFRGFWYDSGEAVARLIEAGARSIYREPDDFTPPPAAERVERDGLVDTLAAYRPAAGEVGDGYRLTADALANPARLPTGTAVTATRDGRLEGRLESTGLVPILEASTPGITDDDTALTVRHRHRVTDRGTTTVERPTPGRTFEWYLELRDASPIEATGEDPVGMGDPPGRSGP